MTLSHFLILAGLLFGVGLTGAVVRRNILVIYMSLEMMLTAAMTSAILFAAASVIVSKKQEHSMPRIPKSAIPYLIACGIVSCGYNRLNITLSGRLPSIVFFPVLMISGANLHILGPY